MKFFTIYYDNPNAGMSMISGSSEQISDSEIQKVFNFEEVEFDDLGNSFFSARFSNGEGKFLGAPNAKEYVEVFAKKYKFKEVVPVEYKRVRELEYEFMDSVYDEETRENEDEVNKFAKDLVCSDAIFGPFRALLEKDEYFESEMNNQRSFGQYLNSPKRTDFSDKEILEGLELLKTEYPNTEDGLLLSLLVRSIHPEIHECRNIERGVQNVIDFIKNVMGSIKAYEGAADRLRMKVTMHYQELYGWEAFDEMVKKYNYKKEDSKLPKDKSNPRTM